MNTCIDCGKEIFKGHGQKRCEECKRLHHNKIVARWYKKQNASKHDLYQFAKFLKTLTVEELQVLVSKYKNELKYIKNFSPDWYLIRSKLKAITTEYSSRDEQLDKIEAYEKDKERDEVLKNGEYDYEEY